MGDELKIQRFGGTEAVFGDGAVGEATVGLRQGGRVELQRIQRGGGKHIAGAEHTAAVADGAERGSGDGIKIDASRGGNKVGG